MKKILFIVLIFFFIFSIKPKTINSEEPTNIQVIYSDLNVKPNDIIKITINLSNVEYYQSIQLILDLDNNFEIIDTIPCKLNSNSYFNTNEIYVNTFENNIIKFVGFKNNNVIHSSFNNICEINLKVLKNSNNVDDLFKTFKISLFNAEYETIPTNISKSEGLKYNWDISHYEVLVFEDFPNFLDDITISNRNSKDFSIRLIEDDLDNKKIGHQIVSVHIYDYTNEQTIFISKNVEVVDKTPPVITGEESLVINDFELDEFKFHDFLIADNYDETPTIIYMYYDNENKQIDSFESFFEYLKINPIGFIKVKAIDSSNNESEEFIQEIKITDTLPPNLEFEENITVKDIDLESFNIYDYISINDSYDSKPKVEITEGLEFKDKITKSFHETILFYGIDNLGNKTKTNELTINLIDTIKPILEKTKDLEITDNSYISLDRNLKDCFTFSDNLSSKLTYSYIYLMEEKEITLEEFNQNLYFGKTLYLKVTGYDSFNNPSNTISILVKLNDTTKPIINIKNIENDKKYLSINKLDYEVTDNFLNDLNIQIYLNDQLYDNTPITNPGKYVLKIVAIDGNNNKSEEVVSFEIIKNNLIGCGLDSECYYDNYQKVIFVACGILGLVIIIVIIKVLLNRSKDPVK